MLSCRLIPKKSLQLLAAELLGKQVPWERRALHLREQNWKSKTSGGVGGNGWHDGSPIATGVRTGGDGAKNSRKVFTVDRCWGQPGFLHTGLTREDPCSGCLTTNLMMVNLASTRLA